jgi:hypothetical protein
MKKRANPCPARLFWLFPAAPPPPPRSRLARVIHSPPKTRTRSSGKAPRAFPPPKFRPSGGNFLELRTQDPGIPRASLGLPHASRRSGKNARTLASQGSAGFFRPKSPCKSPSGKNAILDFCTQKMDFCTQRLGLLHTKTWTSAHKGLDFCTQNLGLLHTRPWTLVHKTLDFCIHKNAGSRMK